MRQAAAWLALGTFVCLAAPAPAEAHGPCGCLDPVLVRAGSVVRLADSAGRVAGGVGYPAYRVIFNPRPGDLGIAPGYLASAYRADAPTTMVLSRPRREATRKARFRVPDGTPAGMYMVLIFDGEEGGAHNTWDYLHVTDWDNPDRRGVIAQREEPRDRAADKDSASEEPAGSNNPTPWPLILGIALGGLLLGAAVHRTAARRQA